MDSVRLQVDNRGKVFQILWKYTYQRKITPQTCQQTFQIAEDPIHNYFDK